MKRIADGFEDAIAQVHATTHDVSAPAPFQQALVRELGVAEACAIHCRSMANQVAFVGARNAVLGDASGEERLAAVATLQRCLESEIDLCQRLLAIQRNDSRIGFEATNHYMYVPIDLVEKVLNCRDLLERWLPTLR